MALPLGQGSLLGNGAMEVMGINGMLHTLWLWGEMHAGWILVGGVGLSALLNLYLWRRWKSRALASYSHCGGGREKDVRGQPRSAVCSKPKSAAEWRPAGREPQGAEEGHPETLRVSILLPAWNEAEYICECLGAISNLRYPGLELVLCAGGTDGTLGLARRFAPPGAVVLEQRPGEGKQRALERCLEHATGSIIFLTDADCVLDDETFERTLEPVLRGEEVATTGTRQPLDGQKSRPLVAFQWSHHLWTQAAAPMYADTLDGVNAAVRRDVLERVGGFSVPAPIGTDYALSRQLQDAGYRIRFVPESRVRTAYCTGVGEYLRQRSRWFRNRFLHGLRHRRWREVAGHLWAALTSLGMLAVPLTDGLGSRLLWALWLAALSHLVFSQARFTGAAHARGMARLPHGWQYGLFVFYMVVGWVANGWGLVESLIPGWRWRW